MHELFDGLTLYHGSYCEVRHPLLEKCARRKDFGQGFYLTSSREQAIAFLKTSIAKAAANGSIEKEQDFGVLSTFELKLHNDLKVHVFKEANVEWLHCIAAHRKKRLFNEIEHEMSEYDVIVGKVADDATNTTLTAYIGGVF